MVAFTVVLGLGVLTASGLAALQQTHSVERNAQEALRRKFISGLTAAPVQVVNEPAAEGKVPLPVQFIPERSQPFAGQPVAVLRIPAIDVEKVVVEGISDAQLRTGPGRYPGAAMPGEGGTFAIAGLRATYGAPFLKLDRLKPHDTIHVTTGRGEFVYTVSSRKVRLPTQNAALSSYGRDRLVLTTTAPSIKDDRRLVVTALLQDHTTRALAKVEMPAGDAGEDYPEEAVPDLQLNPLGRLAATNVTPRIVAPGRPSEAAAPEGPGAPPPPPPPPPPAPVESQDPGAQAPPPVQPAPAPDTPAPASPTAGTAPAPTGPASQPAAAQRTLSAPAPSPDASATRTPNPLAPACSNGIDDDGDGLIDFRAPDGSRQDRNCNGWDDDDE